jgi:hypothetical protein
MKEFKCYIINLERRTDRKKFFMINYNNLGPNLELEFVRAIDGTDIS